MGSEEDNCCRCCPFGGLTSVPIFLSVLAWFFVNVMAWDCTYVTISVDDRQRGAGFWSVDYHVVQTSRSGEDSCVDWPSGTEFDAAWRFGKGLSVILFLLASFFLIMISVLSCATLTPILIRSLAIGLVVTGFLCLLLLASMASDLCDETCQLSWGASLSIASFGLYVVCAAMLWYCFSNVRGGRRHNEVEVTAYPVEGPCVPEVQAYPTVAALPPAHGAVPDIEVANVVHPDGTVTRTTTQTTVHPDGSKTVEQTIEDIVDNGMSQKAAGMK